MRPPTDCSCWSHSMQRSPAAAKAAAKTLLSTRQGLAVDSPGPAPTAQVRLSRRPVLRVTAGSLPAAAPPRPHLWQCPTGECARPLSRGPPRNWSATAFCRREAARLWLVERSTLSAPDATQTLRGLPAPRRKPQSGLRSVWLVCSPQGWPSRRRAVQRSLRSARGASRTGGLPTVRRRSSCGKGVAAQSVTPWPVRTGPVALVASTVCCPMVM